MAQRQIKQVEIYTDGACIGNPGPGGYGVILKHSEHQKELSGGFRRTTNNRVEIIAAITGLESLREKCSVTLHSDSEYLVKAMTLGWARKWRASGWRKSNKEGALNPDLWERLINLCDYHTVEFRWVRGHAGHPENERCDQIAMQAARQHDLPVDAGYVRGG